MSLLLYIFVSGKEVGKRRTYREKMSRFHQSFIGRARSERDKISKNESLFADFASFEMKKRFIYLDLKAIREINATMTVKQIQRQKAIQIRKKKFLCLFFIPFGRFQHRRVVSKFEIVKSVGNSAFQFISILFQY